MSSTFYAHILRLAKSRCSMMRKSSNLGQPWQWHPVVYKEICVDRFTDKTQKSDMPTLEGTAQRNLMSQVMELNFFLSLHLFLWTEISNTLKISFPVVYLQFLWYFTFREPAVNCKTTIQLRFYCPAFVGGWVFRSLILCSDELHLFNKRSFSFLSLTLKLLQRTEGFDGKIYK